jgi:hypothetical protein
VNLSTGRVLIIVALIVGGLAVLANGFGNDAGSTEAAVSPTTTSSPTGHASPTDTASPTTTETPTPTPPPQKTGVLFMALNGTDVAGAGAAAQVVLTDAGYQKVQDAADAPVQNVKRTTIYYRDDADAAQNEADAAYVAKKYFKHAAVKKLDSAVQGVVPDSATIVVVVGSDYATQLVGA